MSSTANTKRPAPCVAHSFVSRGSLSENKQIPGRFFPQRSKTMDYNIPPEYCVPPPTYRRPHSAHETALSCTSERLRPSSPAREKVYRPHSSKPDLGRTSNQYNSTGYKDRKSILLKYRNNKNKYGVFADGYYSCDTFSDTTRSSDQTRINKNFQSTINAMNVAMSQPVVERANGNDPTSSDNIRRSKNGYLLDANDYRTKPFNRCKVRPMSSKCGRVSWQIQPEPKKDFSVCLTGSRLNLQRR